MAAVTLLVTVVPASRGCCSSVERIAPAARFSRGACTRGSQMKAIVAGEARKLGTKTEVEIRDNLCRALGKESFGK